ncbi:centrosome and spindle pole-associated protein 1 isoform X2 [Hoplias malabaricus]|uniref:centrosome and spindle pole-associated protein 1 isoform X2 n=1 Tax=Hoplias malabaricus TaxID=27720 RepID=UPI003461CCE5
MDRVTPVNFVQHKPKMATDYTPYMEMKSNVDDTKLLNKNTTKPKQSKEEGHGLSLQLGEEYERKKQKLKEELRLDYRHYVAKKKELGAGDPYTQPQIWPPPLRERRSTKPPGRDPFGSATPSHTLHSPDPRGQRNSPSPERLLFSKRDVGTVTDPAVRSVPRPSQRRWEETLERKLKHCTSEEELNSEEEQEELELLQKKRVRNRQVPGHAARRERRIQHSVNRVAQERREAEVSLVNEEEYEEENRRTTLATIKTNVPVQDRAASKTNMVDFATGLMIGAVEEEKTAQKRKARYRLELLEQIAEQRKNKRKEKELDLRVAATGAIDPEKQPDRIKQFAAVKREFEGRRKDIAYRPGLELDPLRADLNRRTQEEKPTQKTGERKEPPDRPRVAFQSPILEYSAALGHLSNVAGAGVRLGVGGVTPLSEEFQKGISGALGEMVSPRVISVPPPPVPALSEAYSTPYDDAYYYYGARNPLDPNLPYYGPPEATVQSLPKLPSGAHTTILHPAAALLAQASSQHDTFPPDRHQQPKENTLSYKDALKQQIEDRQERRQREREERAYNDAKLEAEMKAYEPWGRGGGGAPLRDDQGNLISDLKRMHRTNEEAYINQESRGRRALPPTRLMEALSRAEDKESSGHIVSGFTFTQASPYARGNIFSDLPTTQQLHEQERYKESLKQQIEEKRRIEADTKERLRLEEEREEKRLTEQRARIQKEYEEEQEKRKRKEVEQNAKNQEIIRQAEERRKEIERRRKEEEAKDSESVRQQYEQERQARLEQEFRSQSPPIPTVQKRLGYKNPPRPPSLESRRSAAVLSSLSVSAPLSPPVPAQRNQIRASEEQQGVINELSVLRKRLRSEQRRLEGQLLQSEREDMQSPLNSRAHRPLDVFDMARLKMHIPARRPSSNARPINQQNVQEFNQLKYRDSESREQVRRVYPEPPGDEVSLELQQQALLREQQRRLNHMRRARDYFDLSSPMKPPHPQEILAEEAERHSLLHSESAFIDPNGYSFPMTPQPELRAGQSSARERRRQVRRLDFDDGVETPGRETNSQPLSSVNSFQMEGLQEHNQRRMKTLDSMSAQGWKSGQLSADEDDDLWQQSPSPVNARRVSTTTIATEPWLRPGTTETLKGMMAGRRPSSREWEGPSTYHG